MPDVTVTPTVLLIALATRLAAHLARTLQPGTAAGRPIVEKKAPMREFAGG
jgi:hypothetical protein